MCCAAVLCCAMICCVDCADALSKEKNVGRHPSDVTCQCPHITCCAYHVPHHHVIVQILLDNQNILFRTLVTSSDGSSSRLFLANGTCLNDLCASRSLPLADGVSSSPVDAACASLASSSLLPLRFFSMPATILDFSTLRTNSPSLLVAFASSARILLARSASSAAICPVRSLCQTSQKKSQHVLNISSA